jgi:hypothetical protein
MSPLMDYAWPGFCVGLVIGAVAATRLYRRRLIGRPKWTLIGGGIAIAIAAMLIWSGPLGAGQRFADRVDRIVATSLNDNEMTQVSGRLFRGPLTRRVFLSGPADEFQRSELILIIRELPGVASATWNESRGGGVPLVAEGAAIAGAGFLLGMLLAYLLELHRRYNAQWNW